MAESVQHFNSTTTQPNVAINFYRRDLGSPALGTSTAVLAATASVTSSNVTTGITSPDVPRNVTATPGGTTANVTAVSVVVTGTDIEGQVLTETLPAFTAASSSAVTGSKAFATVTSIAIPAVGSATTVAVGLGSKLGLPFRTSLNTVFAAYLATVRETTAPTVTFDATNICNNTVTLNSALAGTAVSVILADR